MLLMGGKNTTSPSTPEGDFSLQEPGPPHPMEDRGKASHVAPQPTTARVENLSRQLELLVFEGSDLTTGYLGSSAISSSMAYRQIKDSEPPWCVWNERP